MIVNIDFDLKNFFVSFLLAIILLALCRGRLILLAFCRGDGGGLYNFWNGGRSDELLLALYRGVLCNFWRGGRSDASSYHCLLTHANIVELHVLVLRGAYLLNALLFLQLPL